MAESSQRADAPLPRAIALARDALAEAPAGLLTDFDGTISPIVNDPAAARLVAGVEGALAALAQRLAVVAVITGRTPLDARRMTGVPGILIAGNHGMEWLEPDESDPTTASGAAGEVLPALVAACDVVLADPTEVAELLVALSR